MIIDTVTCSDGISYTLARVNTGECVITDSDGSIQILGEIPTGEALNIFYDQYGPNKLDE